MLRAVSEAHERACTGATLRWFAAAVALGLFAAGCSSALRAPVRFGCADAKMQPIPTAVERISFDGFSIAPPRGDRWCIGALDRKRGAVFGTSPVIGETLTAMPPADQQAHTLTATALVVYVDEDVSDASQLRAFVERWIGAGQPSSAGDGRWVIAATSPPAQRVTAIDSSVALDDAPGCIRYDATFEERDNPRAPGQVLVWTLRRNLLCRLSGGKSRFVMIGACERYSKTYVPSWTYWESAGSELDAFTRSLRIDASP
jgi:hypothetical protein